MSRTILLADDSLTIQKVVELTFADTEYEVVTVSSGDELLAQLPECRPDLVICDVIMPGRDGYDVCQEIKSNPGTLHLPVILLTGTFEPFDRDRALAAGCSEIVTKPFEARKLVEAVERLANEGQFAAGAAATGPAMEHEGQVVPPQPESSEGVEFATHLAEPIAPPSNLTEESFGEESEGLDFTATGFAEMEEAGEAQREASFEAPAEGLEFDLGEESDEEYEEMAESEEQERAMESTDTAPLPEPLPVTPEDLSASDVAEVMGEETPETSPDYAEFESGEVPELPEEIGEVSFAEDNPEEIPAEAAGAFAMEAAPVEALNEVTATEEGHEAAAEEFEEGPSAEEASEIDTQDFTEDAARTEEPAATSLSDEDVDRIARKLLELAGERIEQIAWEVVPDMAELVVRERIREIEAEMERETPETIQ
ncbi:MAG: response regulator [Acidobacteriota bacterium]